MNTARPLRDKASAALKAAHEACFNHPDRDALGMSHGPFSGVNEALSIVTQLEDENGRLRKQIEALKAYSGCVVKISYDEALDTITVEKV